MNDIELDAGEAARIERLRGLWRTYGAAMNLTSKTGSPLEAHIEEARQLVRLARKLGAVGAETTWVDIGSGGGFPGLVVAALTDVSLTLVEPRERRASFLELALATIGRKSARVVRARLTPKGWQYIGRRDDPIAAEADCVGSRATFPPERWMSLASQVVRPGGLVFAHLRTDAPDPHGHEAIDQVDSKQWSVRGYRSTTAGK